MWRPWAISPCEADTAMAVSLGSGWRASSAPGTAHHCYYLHHSTKPDKIALHCYMVTILILNEKKNAISSANLDDTIDFCIFFKRKRSMGNLK